MAILTSESVIDELAIRELAARFSDAVNRRDGAQIAELFIPEGRWNVPGVPETVGHAAIESAFGALVGQFPFLVQLLHSGVVELDGERATARWYLSEHARGADGGGSLFVGYYEDELVRSAGEWRFQVRTFHFLYRGRDELPGRPYPHANPKETGGEAAAP